NAVLPVRSNAFLMLPMTIPEYELAERERSPPFENRRAPLDKGLNAFFHVLAVHDAMLDLRNVVDRSLLAGLDIFQRRFFRHLNPDRSIFGDQLRDLHRAFDLLA